MSLFQRAGTLWYDFTIEGRRVRESAHTADPDAAKAAEAKRRAEVHAEVVLGVKPAAVVAAEAEPEATLGEAFASYAVDVLKVNAPRNLKRSAATTRVLARVCMREVGRNSPEDTDEAADARGRTIPLSQVADRVVAWRRRHLASGLKASTLNRYLATLKAALNHAGFDYADDDRVAAKFAPSEEDGDRVRFLSPDENARLFRALAQGEAVLRDFVLFLLDTGSRRTEALELEWSKVDLDRVVDGRPAPTVTLRDSKARKLKWRTLPVSARLAPVLRRMHARRTDARVWPWDVETLAVRDRVPTERQTGVVTPATERPPGVSKAAPWFAWIKVDGRKLHLGTFPTEAEAIDARRAAERAHFRPVGPEVHGLRYAWEKTAERANLVDFHLHDCRHDFATRMLRATHDIALVSKLLGHANLKMSAKYAHVDAHDLDRAIALADAALAAKSPALDFMSDTDPIVVVDGAA